MATDAFRAALSRIGWSNQAATALVDEGFNSISDIGNVDKDTLKATCAKIRKGRAPMEAGANFPAVPGVVPATIPMMCEFKLYGMHLWVTEKIRQGAPVNAPEFTAEVAGIYATKLRDVIMKQDAKKEDDVVKTPADVFTKDSNWRRSSSY